jgi:hypothetical protein
MLPQKNFEIKSLKIWNAISSILRDDYKNSEDCKVHETHDFSWLYAGVRELYIENKNFTFVFIENLPKAKLVKLRDSAGFAINNLHPIVYLFLTYWMHKMIICFG